MRDYKKEFESRVEFLREALSASGAKGFVYGNSGGKDSALVGILCKAACENTVGIIMPCASKRNFGEDFDDGRLAADKFNIETRVLDLTEVRQSEIDRLEGITVLTPAAVTNLAPRLRMLTLYAVAASEGLLVAGTGNRDEAYMGYFTKWGDGAYDVNPIADLGVRDVYGLLEYLGAPESIIKKAPSAGLFEGQTDEGDMGVTYEAIGRFIETGEASDSDRAIIERYHRSSGHKRSLPLSYKGQ